MHALIINQDQLELPSEIIETMRDELTRGGVRFGKFYVGAIRRLPESVYFLWHLTGEMPVSATFPLELLSHPALARIAVEEFLGVWSQVIH